MAAIKWSGLVSEVKGVLNGSILSSSANGQIIRNRVSGGGRKTDIWGRRKRALAFRAGQWRALSASQQSDWQTMAPSYPYINKFGDPVIPSGYQLYCTINLNLGLSFIAALTTPVAPTAPESIGTPVFSSSGAGVMEFYYTFAAGGLSNIIIYASPPMSKGVTSPPRNMRMLTSFSSDNASPKDLALDYARVFNAVPAAGRVYLKAVQIQKATGQRYGEVVQLLDY